MPNFKSDKLLFPGENNLLNLLLSQVQDPHFINIVYINPCFLFPFHFYFFYYSFFFCALPPPDRYRYSVRYIIPMDNNIYKINSNSKIQRGVWIYKFTQFTTPFIRIIGNLVTTYINRFLSKMIAFDFQLNKTNASLPVQCLNIYI